MMILQADPFPDPTHAGQEIEFIGMMFGSVLIILVLIILMIYMYASKRYFVPILIVYLFSLIFAMTSFDFGIPFSPYIQIFFMLLQTGFFAMTAIEVYRK